MINIAPIIGHGFDTFSTVHNDFQADYFRSNPNDFKNAFLADSVNYSIMEVGVIVIIKVF